MLATKVGIVDLTDSIDPREIIAAAAAINIQVTRDLPQFWPVNATVSYLPDHTAIPQGVWPVQLVKSLPPGEGGFHQTKNRQPYAKVIATPGSDEWTVDASHEIVEMLIDPSGSRLQTSRAIRLNPAPANDGDGVSDDVGQFEYVVEACDPCEADPFTYPISGVTVSDFITPHYYEPTATPGTRYSFNGSVQRPRQLLRGGYISFINPQSSEVQQILWVDPGPPVLRDLGPTNGKSLRVHVEEQTHGLVHAKRAGPTAEAKTHRAADREAALAAAQARAHLYEPA